MPVNASVISLGELDGSNGFRLDGIDNDDASGRSVASAGDVNGDGFDDILVGANRAEPYGTGHAGGRAGESYVVFGKATGFAAALDLSTLDGSNGFQINGIDAYDISGSSVASAGDVNGDGLNDIIIGAPGAGTGGESYVIFGKTASFAGALNLTALDGSNGFSINGIDANDSSGCSVSSAGDMNGDGFDDLIIGACTAAPGGNKYAGESYVVFGKADGFGASFDLSGLDGTIGFRLDGIDAGDFSGISVSSAGDVNGDGFDDIIIGANRADVGGNYEAGESYVVFGKAAGFEAALDLARLDGTSGFRIVGVDAEDRSGWSVSSAGDVNGDGFDDLIIGALDADPRGNNYAGESYVVFGNATGFEAVLNLSNLNGTNGFIINGIDAYDSSGLTVSLAGDVNGDGFDDIIIGANRADVGGNYEAGESYVIFGKVTGFGASLDLSSLDGTNGFRLEGIDAYDRSGSNVASAGDVNGDGFDDIIIGAYGAASGHEYMSGESYVIFGSRSLESVTITGTRVGLTHNGGYGSDTIYALGGNDTVLGWEGNDTIDSGSGADAIDGGSGRDIISGGTGKDTLKGGSGIDTLTGGTGNDTYITDGLDTLTEAADAGTDTVQSSATFTLGDNFEHLTLTGTANRDGTGNALNNTITGNSGNNVLDGADGKDVLIGGAGRDTLTGGLGFDSFRFASGDTGQTALTLDRITDFTKGALGVGDEFDFASILRTGGSAAAATSSQAAINQATGVTTFAAGSGTTLTDALKDIVARIDAVGTHAGDFALFQVNGTGDYHLFVSDGTAGVSSGDVLVQLSGITAISTINLTGGDLTILG